MCVDTKRECAVTQNVNVLCDRAVSTTHQHGSLLHIHNPMAVGEGSGVKVGGRGSLSIISESNIENGFHFETRLGAQWCMKTGHTEKWLK